MSQFFNKAEAMFLHLLTLLKTDVEDYCELETINDDHTLVYSDGSMATICEFHGTKTLMGRDDYIAMIRHLTASLTPFLGRGNGHQLQVLFRRDLDASETLTATSQQQLVTASKIGLSIVDLITEGTDTYARYVYDEACYLVFWSRPALLDPIEKRQAARENNEFRAEVNWPAMGDAQNLLRPIGYLRDRHTAFVSKITSDLRSPQLGCALEILPVHDAIRAVRKSMVPDATARTWRPALPGDAITFRWKEGGPAHDASAVGFPTLPSQIMTNVGKFGSKKDALLPDPSTVRIAGRVYAPLMMTMPPSDPQFFATLFNSLNQASTNHQGGMRAMPYSISFMLRGDGVGAFAMKEILAGVLGFTSETNRNIMAALRLLRERKRDGEVIAKLNINCMTWSDDTPEGVRELQIRKNKLTRTLQGWGNMQLAEKSGNPMTAIQANALALSPRAFGTVAAPPLYDAIAVLPLSRPASPFSRGSTLFRSLDGKALKYQRFSSQQTTWITLIGGKPGSGKSVLMNHNNVESCVLPGLTKLPYIGIIDIGVSSSGFIDLVRDSLPIDQKHLVLYKRLQNSKADCINVLDTPLTMRKPLPRDREFQKTFLTTLVTAAERKGAPIEGMSAFIGRMIDMAFARCDNRSDKASPKKYNANLNKVVDAAIAEIGFHVMPATCWWEIVDALFAAKMYYEAEIAQRYAVPALIDLTEVANNEEIRKEYQMTERGKEVWGSFTTGVREAVADFPVFSSVTCFDIASARIAALDLQDVAMKGSDAAKKQTALMYMVARQSFMKKLAFSLEDLPFFDDHAKPYYQRLITELVDEYKVLCMDELHMTEGHVGLREQLMTDGRVSRKWQMEICLASQLMEDFGEIGKIATSLFILDAGTEATRTWMRDNIGLTPVEERALVDYVHGPADDGSGTTFLAKFVTKEGEFSQLYTCSIGPMRLWALSTTAEDRKLRDLLYAAMPKSDARRLLARHFPNGGCKKLIDRLKSEQFVGQTFVDDDQVNSVIEGVAKQLLDAYRHDLSQAA
ncbi:MAG: type IV secretion protein DotO [Rhodanobacter sp.]|jgi:intracellular multiplication protein IcmB